MKKKMEPFQPSVSEIKANNTTLVAKNFIDEETASRDAKTKRLREARRQREAYEPKEEKEATSKRAEN